MDWTFSKVANYIRGIEKININPSTNWDEWNTWNENESENYFKLWDLYKNKRPIRFWIAEELIWNIQIIVNKPINVVNNIVNYINNKYIKKTHMLSALSEKILIGKEYNINSMVLPVLFNALVDFVEIIMVNKCNNGKRYPEIGFDLINHGIFSRYMLTDDIRKEIIYLYNWWKEYYPIRDLELNNIREYYYTNQYREDLTDIECQQMDEYSVKMYDMQVEFEKEDNEMLHRFINISKYLEI
jgi:hypothetical protein